MTQVLQVQPWDFCPQPGPQTEFLSTPADITVMGGAAYVGKTWAEVFFPLRYVHHPKYTAAIYRQMLSDVIHPGGLWDEASGIYPAMGGVPNRHDWSWKFPSGASIKFAHATDEERVKGSQVATILLDELTHFDEDFVWALNTRNRSRAPGVPSQVLGTTNPDADSWVADFLGWWIEQNPASPDYGLPIPERAGKVRYLARIEGVNHWGARVEDLLPIVQRYPRGKREWIQSVRFIPGKLEDNALGLALNPGYEGRLASADPVSVARLLGGNWKIRRAKGTLFKPQWFTDATMPPRLVKIARGWDLAATEGAGDWTVGVLLGLDEHGLWWVLDVVRDRRDPGGVEQLVRATAERDGQDVPQVFAWERAGAGKSQAHTYTRLLAGWNVTGETESGDPATRASAWSAQVSQRRVRLLCLADRLGQRVQVGTGCVLASDWTAAYLAELEAFPEGKHDDQLAATLAAFRFLTGGLAGAELASADQVVTEFNELADDAAELDGAFDLSGVGKMGGW